MSHACAFCEITARRGEASIVARTPTVTAFLVRYPVADGHTLIVPNSHYRSVGDVPDAVGDDMWQLARRLVVAIRTHVAPSVMLHLADGEEAGQDVAHVHLHVIPRHEGDSVDVVLPGSKPSRERLDQLAAALAGTL